MPNMSYCRFENTANDLADCYNHIEDDVEELNDYEQRGRKRLVSLCKDILEAEGYLVEEDE